MRSVWMALAIASVGTAAAAGPFGLEMGMPASKLQVIGKSQAPNTFRIAPPSPDAEFTAYVVVASPKDGVCKVFAYGKIHENDADGATIRTVFNSVKADLAKQYGASGDFDFVDGTSPWIGRANYAMALRESHRTLASFWDPSEESTLPSDITAIKLEARAASASGTYVTVAYEFQNFDQCSAEPVRTYRGPSTNAG